MKVNYNVKGKERKLLAQTVGKAIGMDAIYKGVPTCAYEIDYFTIDRKGSLLFDNMADSHEVKQVFDAIAAAGFEPQDSGEDRKGIAIQMPMMTRDEISRLEALIESKESLIKKAIGADSLMVGEVNGKMDFPWFSTDSSPEEIKAYMDFVTALCKKAKEARRITAKDKSVENEKYAFRCFLLRLGFIGDDYKTSRKILLRNFTGSAAWKGGVPDGH
ncbi:virulence protein [Hornefia butyriciproducens]|uniref:virulence protein n=1 Tax=Hornefia butyriciproducens TaxID=2652293 RepID=UPI002A915A01|nr:virulence protein [Hornefia butyriciproducens]MCI7413919.1 virulence protein [Clostridiales bacterium]MDY6212428.1 virulence protein [Hornefia butyriciproducens]